MSIRDTPLPAEQELTATRVTIVAAVLRIADPAVVGGADRVAAEALPAATA